MIVVDRPCAMGALYISQRLCVYFSLSLRLSLSLSLSLCVSLSLSLLLSVESSFSLCRYLSHARPLSFALYRSEGGAGRYHAGDAQEVCPTLVWVCQTLAQVF